MLALTGPWAPVACAVLLRAIWCLALCGVGAVWCLALWREGLRAVLLRSRENLRAVLLELCQCTAPWTPQPPAEERERSLLWLLLLCVPPVVVVGSLGVESACAMACICAWSVLAEKRLPLVFQ